MHTFAAALNARRTERERGERLKKKFESFKLKLVNFEKAITFAAALNAERMTVESGERLRKKVQKFLTKAC